MTLSEHAVEEIRALPARFPEGSRSAVMPALDIVQEEIGHLTPEAMAEVAGLLGIDPGYVEGVSTFYSLFHHQPTGRHHFYVCTNLSCMLRGAYDLVDRIRERTGVVAPDQVSADGNFSYQEVECLGACEFAPVMRYAHAYRHDLTPAAIDAIIDGALGGGADPAGPAPGPARPAPRKADG